LEELWRSRVVDYSFTDQLNFVRQVVRPPRGATRDAETRETTQLRVEPRKLVASIIAMVVVALTLSLLSRRREERPHPATTFLTNLERRLTAAHIERHEREDVEALAKRLVQDHHPLATAVGRATRRYLEARFGKLAMSAGEARALLDAVHPK
jgi:hypothetical protein